MEQQKGGRKPWNPGRDEGPEGDYLLCRQAVEVHVSELDAQQSESQGSMQSAARSVGEAANILTQMAVAERTLSKLVVTSPEAIPEAAESTREIFQPEVATEGFRQQTFQLHTDLGEDSEKGIVLQKDNCCYESQLWIGTVTCQAWSMNACSPGTTKPASLFQPGMNERSLLEKVAEPGNVNVHPVFLHGSTPDFANEPEPGVFSMYAEDLKARGQSRECEGLPLPLQSSQSSGCCFSILESFPNKVVQEPHTLCLRDETILNGHDNEALLSSADAHLDDFSLNSVTVTFPSEVKVYFFFLLGFLFLQSLSVLIIFLVLYLLFLIIHHLAVHGVKSEIWDPGQEGDSTDDSLDRGLILNLKVPAKELRRQEEPFRLAAGALNLIKAAIPVQPVQPVGPVQPKPVVEEVVQQGHQLGIAAARNSDGDVLLNETSTGNLIWTAADSTTLWEPGVEYHGVSRQRVAEVLGLGKHDTYAHEVACLQQRVTHDVVTNEVLLAEDNAATMWNPGGDDVSCCSN